MSHDAFTVGLVATVAFAAPAPTSLGAAVLVDRTDRRRVLLHADLARAVVVALFAVAVVAGARSLPLLAGVAAVLESLGALHRCAANAVVPALAGDESGALEHTYGRLATAEITTSSFVGPPIGGWLFALAPALPFALDSLSFVGSGAVVATLPAIAPPPSAPLVEQAGSKRHAVIEGCLWLRHHAIARRLLALSVLSLFGSAAWAGIFVLYAHERLDVTGTGFGVLATAMAAGALVASLVVPRIVTPSRSRTIVLAGLGIDTLGACTLAITRSPFVAVAALVVIAGGATGWSLVTLPARQRLVPDELRGRVTGAHQTCTFAATALGGVAGALLASRVSIAAPFTLAAALTAVAALVACRLPRDLGAASTLAA